MSASLTTSSPAAGTGASASHLARPVALGRAGFTPTGTERDDFVAAQVAHRLLGATERRVAQTDEEIAAFAAVLEPTMFCLDGAARIILFNHELAGAVEFRDGTWRPRQAGSRVRRDLAFLQDAARLGVRARLFAHFVDRTLGHGLARDGLVLPVVQSNRHGNAPGAILWPLRPFYHVVGKPTFVGSGLPDPLPFRAKRPAIVWRGQLSGRDAKERSAKDILTSFDRGFIDADACQRLLLGLPRYAFVARYRDHPICDVGIAGTKPETGLHAQIRFRRPPMERNELLTFRYQVVIEGND